MTPEGYGKISEILQESGIEAHISPIPEPGEDIPQLEIIIPNTTFLRSTFDALRRHQLIADYRQQGHAGSDLLSLLFVAGGGADVNTAGLGLRPFRITFEDLRSRESRGRNMGHTALLPVN